MAGLIQGKKCLVIGAGDLMSVKLQLDPGDMVIAVDGGIKYCEQLRINPDLLIGDFDSVSDDYGLLIDEIEEKTPEKVIRLDMLKDDTDMLAALKTGLDNGCQVFHIYAGTGGRLEHTIANIQCLLFLKGRGAEGYLFDEHGMVFVLKNEKQYFSDQMKGFLSLFSMGKEAKGVTIQGLKYPLHDYTMSNDFPIGISNEFIGRESMIQVTDGELIGIVYHPQTVASNSKL